MKDRRCGAWPRRLRLGLVVVLLVFSMTPPAVMAQTKPPAAQDEFVPLDQLPREEELPAAPLVIGAYGAAWVCIFLYLWSIWRRTGRVERELAELRGRIGTGQRR
jgi:CcmD family protein